MDITIHIHAPELVGALNTLAVALEAKNFEMTQHAIGGTAPVRVATASQAVMATIPNPMPAAPAQPMAQPIVPVAPVAAPVNHTHAQFVPAATQVAPVAVATTAPAPVTAQSVPTTAPTYSPEQLAVAATQLMDSGRQQDILDLLAQFGVQALTFLPKERYGDFANALRQMGAKL